MRLEERKSNETAEDGIVQVSDVSSSTAAAEEHRQPDDVDSAAENEQSVSSSSSDEASLSHVDVSAASDPASVEVAVEKHVTSVNDMDGLAVCLTWNAIMVLGVNMVDLKCRMGDTGTNLPHPDFNPLS